MKQNLIVRASKMLINAYPPDYVNYIKIDACPATGSIAIVYFCMNLNLIEHEDFIIVFRYTVLDAVAVVPGKG